MNKTITNLAKAFAGESMARNRYSFYAKTAKKEGYEQMAGIFFEIAEQEREHASWLIKLINQLGPNIGEIKMSVSLPSKLAKTKDNLKTAIAGENFEHTKMYPGFAKIAQKEGLKDVAERLRSIARAEEHHEERFKKLLVNLEKKAVFKKKQEVEWVCRECGYVYFGKEAPKECPSCGHPKAYYQKKCEDY